MTGLSQELMKDFLDEAFDLLDSLEKSLLVLEKDSQNDQAINSVFRAAHTIKGGAGTVGYNEIQEFTHLLEDVLDMVRKKTVALVTEDISLLLQCRDELEKMLTAREKGSVHDTPERLNLQSQLQDIKKKSVSKVPEAPAKNVVKSAPPVTSMDIELTNSDLSLIHEFVEQNKTVFILQYSLNESYEMKDVSGFQIYALLNDIAEIIKLKPSVQEMETDFYKDVTFIINTEKDETFIRDKTNLTDMINGLKITKITPDILLELEKKNGGDPKPVAAPQSSEPSSQVKKPEQIVSAKTVSSPAESAGEIDMQKRSVASLRVESWKIDELLNLLGELVITKASFTQLNSEFEKIGSDVKSTLKEFMSGIAKLNLQGDAEQVKDKNAVLLEALNSLFVSFDSYSESIQKLNRISTSLQENVMNMRMVPIQMVFSRFPRLIRDMAEKLDKKIDLIIEGVETEIDKGMVDDIFDPLIHILRNSVDHGIEFPKDRKVSGKPETGKIILKAIHEGDSIVIEVTDDGKGIDVDAIKSKAIENGFISKEAADKLSQRELLGLIFIPGLSTAKQVSDLSGRGVGMDVVKKKIEEIGGNVGIATVKGKGTKMVIRLPLTLAIIQGLLIVVNDMHYVIPVASVEETVIVNLKELKEINGRLTLELRGKFMPIMSLKKYFYREEIGAGSDEKEYCIVAKYGESFIGILVNEIVGEQDIVIKSLNTKLIKSPGISAATIIGNGDIGYIIDTSQIIAHYFKSINQ